MVLCVAQEGMSDLNPSWGAPGTGAGVFVGGAVWGRLELGGASRPGIPQPGGGGIQEGADRLWWLAAPQRGMRGHGGVAAVGLREASGLPGSGLSLPGPCGTAWLLPGPGCSHAWLLLVPDHVLEPPVAHTGGPTRSRVVTPSPVCPYGPCLRSALGSLLLPWAAAMSRGSSGTSVDDKTLLLEYRCHPVRAEPPSPTCGAGKRSPTTAPSATPLSPLASPTSAEPRRIVLSTDSPAALKVGTQQLIPKSLAVSSKPKSSPSRHQSFGASREPLSPDPKRAAVPVLALEAEDEDDGGGALKRNLRNMSYRAAMKGLGAELEPAKAPPSLKPVSEDGSTPPDRSPGRSKRTLGRKRVQKRGGSFKDQPRLYQEIRERGLNSVSHESDEDLLEEALPEEPSPLGAAIVVQSYRPAQVTWSQLPEVLESGILQRISPEERKRQEAMFEIITSEYSYMHSLSILVGHFMRSEELKETMTQTEHHHLFSNIGDILTVSTSFFEDLEKRHQEHLLIPDISDIVEEHASKHFNPYISYCSNEVYQQRTLEKLLWSRAAMRELGLWRGQSRCTPCRNSWNLGRRSLSR
ncbi:rho guanine nucleotide exchange factor 16 isoform X3 [Vidua chalybeata]|uniref:rho guanine nucleotide exchange factor 16 isoform X3 n=1 Tax=Vidua chalybeata TaxID=81927 RepID=UPI0023A89063|nr:rho guanine nucleotide exchange factor 16 isoform X3 [Vidua chalybeata]